jgi:signal peptidase II
MNDALASTPELAMQDQSTARAGQKPGAVAVFVVVTLAVLAADQILKYVAFATIAGDRQITLIPHVLSLKLITNTGAVFGLGKGFRWVFIVVSFIAIPIIARIFWRSPARARGLHLALALILAGALGNLYDRILFSAVRDMLWLFPSTGMWPWIFNLADAALMAGVAGILLLSLLSELRRPALRSTRG